MTTSSMYLHPLNKTHACIGCTTGDVRLADGPDMYSGRVEVCMNGQWGTVCETGWGARDGAVVCNQLGFGTGIKFMLVIECFKLYYQGQ